ncbi:hypothetical protein SUGI_0670050, partial [Cryptomeria japonica]
LKNGSTVAMLL